MDPRSPIPPRCIDQDLSSAPHPVGPWGRAQPSLGPLLFLADGAVTTTPVSNTPNCHQLDGFLTGMTASPATTLTTRLHALSVISHSPSINTTTTEESPRWAKTLYGQVPGRSSLAERKEAGVLGTAGPSNGVSQACQENFPDSDSPIPTAPPPDENSMQSPDERRPLFDSDILEARLIHPQYHNDRPY